MEKEYALNLLKETRQDYNRIADQFAKNRVHFWEEMKFLGDYTRDGERVLDLGCGNGRLFGIFEEKKIDYIGIDTSKKLLEINKTKYPNLNFQVADALNLPFPRNFFDKIYSIAVFHHIPSEELRLQFLNEARRVLKPRGLLILTVWNLWQTFSTQKLILKFGLLSLIGLSKLDFRDIVMPWQNISHTYFHCFTQQELEKITKKAGFKIKKSGEIKVKGKKPNSNLYIIAEK